MAPRAAQKAAVPQKAAAPQQQPQQKIFPDLAWFEDEKPVVPPTDQAKTIEALKTQIADLTSRVAQPQALPVPRQMQALRPQLSTEPDFSTLPDPVVDPRGYADGMVKAIRTADANARQLEQFDVQQANQGQNARNALWADFQNAYSDYDDFDQVEFFATKAAKDLQARGVDVEAYMMTNKDAFFKDVVGRIEKALGPKTEVEPEPENRTEGIFGGLEGGNKPARTLPPSGGSMFDDMKAWQLKTGFHR